MNSQNAPTIPLGRAITDLRAELLEALREGAGKELRFRLKVISGALHSEPAGSALCLGRLRLPLPLRLGPRVIASEQSVPGSDQIEVAVEVGLPLFGLLISYGGRLAVCEAPG